MATKTDIARLELKLAEETGALGMRIAESKGGLIKWVAGVVFAQTAALVAFLKLV